MSGEPQVIMVECERCGKPVRDRDVVIKPLWALVDIKTGQPIKEKCLHVCPDCAGGKGE